MSRESPVRPPVCSGVSSATMMIAAAMIGSATRGWSSRRLATGCRRGRHAARSSASEHAASQDRAAPRTSGRRTCRRRTSRDRSVGRSAGSRRCAGEAASLQLTSIVATRLRRMQPDAFCRGEPLGHAAIQQMRGLRIVAGRRELDRPPSRDRPRPVPCPPARDDVAPRPRARATRRATIASTTTIASPSTIHFALGISDTDAKIRRINAAIQSRSRSRSVARDRPLVGTLPDDRRDRILNRRSRPWCRATLHHEPEQRRDQAESPSAIISMS